MGVRLRFRMRWILHSAAIFLGSALVLLLVLRVLLGRGLGHDYARGFRTLSDLESSLRLAVGVPVAVYVVLVGVAVTVAKVLISHRIAGPLFRLERCADALRAGDFSFSTRLRRNDELRGLAEGVSALRDRSLAEVTAARAGVARVLETWDGIGRLSDEQFRQEAEDRLARLDAELDGLAQQLHRTRPGAAPSPG
jgi:HAMP domain-containing protein